MTAGPPDPLILTVRLDPESQQHFDRLRERYFPPSINYLAAHVTLFHHLPGEQQDAIENDLAQQCGSVQPTTFTATSLRFLGRGTAISLEMLAVADLRKRLASHWAPWLTAQDRQAWKPHVTVQNKVAPTEARKVHAALQAGFTPFQGQVTGLEVWAYRGGPWDFLAFWPFSARVLET